MNDVTRKQIKEIRDAKRNKESSDIHFLLGWIERQEKEIVFGKTISVCVTCSTYRIGEYHNCIDCGRGGKDWFIVAKQAGSKSKNKEQP